MRTTIELSDDRRAKLLEFAARRGEKGFSGIIAEAIDLYVAHQAGKPDAVARALLLKGALRPKEAAELRSRVGEIRSKWR
jgi:hypothetical protein